jgi:cytochrome c oxidase cbb3-type subunit 3
MLGRIFATAFLVILSASAWSAAGTAQTRELKNPVEGQRKAIEQGDFLYKRRCSNCHGLDARGYRAPDLTAGQFANGTSDAQLYRVITRGIPATEMLPTNMNEDEVWAVISYLRTVVTPNSKDVPKGNAQAGEAIFSSKGGCGSCHMVNGKGGRLGPDLSRIGLSRSRTALVREIRTPSEYIPPGYEAVTVVTREGRQIKGIRKNEDSFSIQIMDTNEQLSTFLKKDLREVIDEKKSLMPDYGPDKLAEAELDDLMAYLRTLHGPAGR